MSEKAGYRFLQSKFRLRVEFTARSYGQLIQNKLLMFRPSIVTRPGEQFAEGDERFCPILMSLKWIAF